MTFNLPKLQYLLGNYLNRRFKMMKNLIHQMVGPKISPFINTCLQTWKALENNGFEIKIWNDDLINRFVENNYPNYMNIIANARNHAEAADIARYLIIYHCGGIYIDWDIELLNVDGFIKIINNCPNGFLVLDPDNGTIASECFAANQGESYLFNLVQEIKNVCDTGNRDNFTTPQLTGPFRMKEILKKYKSNQRIIEVKDIFVYSYAEIRKFPPKLIKQPLIHYWVHSWITS